MVNGCPFWREPTGKRRAVLLQVEGIRLLVGVAPGRVQTLHVLGDTADAGSGFEAQLDSALTETDR